MSPQQRISGKRDYKEQDVQLHWRGSELRVSRHAYGAEQLADELAWPLQSNQISAQLAHLWGYSDFSRRDLCFLKVASGRETQMTAPQRSCALLFHLPEQSGASWMRAPVGDRPCQKAVLSAAWGLMLWPPASPVTFFTPLLASPSAHGTRFLIRCPFPCLLCANPA